MAAPMGLVAWRQRNTRATEQAISDLCATVDFACERSDVNPEPLGRFMLTSVATGGQDGPDLGCGRRAAAHRAPPGKSAPADSNSAWRSQPPGGQPQPGE